MKTKIFLATIFILYSSNFLYAYSVVENMPLWEQNDLGYDVINRDVNSMDSEFYSPDYMGFFNKNIYSGYYLGTIILGDDNNNSGDEEFVRAVSDYCFAWAGQCIDLENQKIFKAEDENDWSDGDLSVTFDPLTGDDYGKSGSWEFSNQSKGFGFYAVKASHEMALYFVSPTFYKGFWNTLHVRNKAGNLPSISHLSGIDPPIAVPEPSTMLLLGLGLLGLGFVVSRQM